jgi:hypothetical protein
MTRFIVSLEMGLYNISVSINKGLENKPDKRIKSLSLSLYIPLRRLSYGAINFPAVVVIRGGYKFAA